jgi:hypothetical protein
MNREWAFAVTFKNNSFSPPGNFLWVCETKEILEKKLKELQELKWIEITAVYDDYNNPLARVYKND